jgi:membrane protein
MDSNLPRATQLLGRFTLAGLVVTFERAKSEAHVAAGTGGKSEESSDHRSIPSPTAISASGWWEVLKRTIIRTSENDLFAAAASVTFYSLLAIFPALAALVSVYGLMANPKAIGEHLDTVSGIVPSGGVEIITDQINRLTAQPPSGLQLGVVLGLLVALWSANQGTKALFAALNLVYGEKEQRSFFVFTAQTIAFTTCALLFMMIALSAVVVLPIFLNFFDDVDEAGRLVAIGRWPAILLIVALFLACLYRFGPSRVSTHWRWITPGSVLASIAWVVLSVGFSWYVAHFGSYDKTYGSLGAAIGFMTWIWLSTTIILIGAQLNAETERQSHPLAPRAPGTSDAQHDHGSS